ncbi:MAG: polysaccharide biosynthesis/export family protein [Hyphomicrobium sp.]
MIEAGPRSVELGVTVPVNAPSDAAHETKATGHQNEIAVVEETPTGVVSPPLPATSNPHALRISIGDQLKIAVYERLVVEEDKWAKANDRAKPPMMALQMRTEFTGDYSVQEDGSVSLPLLGTFSVDGKTLEDIQGAITSVFEKTLGRPGIINVRLAERLPVYVLGPVKASGLYKFTAGMTAWHAVALAGGFERIERVGDNLGNRLEATREIGNIQRNTDRVASLMARKAVLTAERDNRSVTAPAELSDLVGRESAAALIAGEEVARALLTAAMQARLSGIRASVEAARSELGSARQRTGLIELTIKGQDDRLTSLKMLGAEGLVKRPQLLEAEVQMSQAQERREEAKIGSSQAVQRISQAEQELARVISDANLELESQISTIDRELVDAKSQRDVALHVLEVLRGSTAPADRDLESRVQYQIVRRSGGQPLTIAAKGDTELRPGDLVKLTISRTTED